MPRKPDDAEQSKRFIEMAREIGAGERPDAFEKVFQKVVRPTAAPVKPSARQPQAAAKRVPRK